MTQVNTYGTTSFVSHASRANVPAFVYDSLQDHHHDGLAGAQATPPHIHIKGRHCCPQSHGGRLVALAIVQSGGRSAAYVRTSINVQSKSE